MLSEAIEAGIEIEAVYCEPRARHLVPDLPRGVGCYETADGVVTRIASTVTPQPVIASARIPAGPVPSAPTFVLVCDRVTDPGNAGTIIRSAEAAGADAVVFTPGSVDPWNPKCVRASAGASFWLPLVIDRDPSTLGLALVGAVAHGGETYTSFDFTRPCALVVGNEAGGIDVSVPLEASVTIAHLGRSESLNVAMAATVLCFEVARQRAAR